jgi:RNA polymerase sigma-70 factor (ECF subfamily)
MDEIGLIQDARKGDLEAFNRLVLAYQDRLYNHAWRMLGDGAAAADVVQETFITAYEKLSTYRGGSFRAWLTRIVTNRCYDELRRRKRRPTTSLEPLDADDQEIESPGWMVDPADGPEETTEKTEVWNALQRCLDHLSPDFRAALVCVDIQEMDYQEAADALGCAMGTVKSRLARARLNVRNCLQSVAELLPTIFRLGSEDSV